MQVPSSFRAIGVPLTMCDLQLLETPQAESFCGDLRCLLRTFWECDELIPEVFYDILCSERRTFKKTSNQGFIWIQKRHKDIGNYAYALLYILLVEDAMQYHTSPSVILRFYLDLRDRYETVDVDNPNWEMKADVIECILEKAMQTGPGVNRDDIGQRLKFMACMREYAKWFDLFLHIISCNGLRTDGPPCVRHLPDLRETVWAIKKLAP